MLLRIIHEKWPNTFWAVIRPENTLEEILAEMEQISKMYFYDWDDVHVVHSKGEIVLTIRWDKEKEKFTYMKNEELTSLLSVKDNPSQS